MGESAESNMKYKSYTIGHGDRIDLIAHQSGDAIADIIAGNPIVNANFTIPLSLYPGRTIRIRIPDQREESKINPPWKVNR